MTKDKIPDKKSLYFLFLIFGVNQSLTDQKAKYSPENNYPFIIPELFNLFVPKQPPALNDFIHKIHGKPAM